MRNIISILATAALGVALTVGPATMSMAHGGGGGHGGGHGHADSGGRGFGDHGSGGRGFGGRGFGPMAPSANRSFGDRGFGFRNGPSGPPIGHDHDVATDCLWLHHNYDPTSGVYFGPDGVRHTCP